MNTLERALIEKAGYGNGFENVVESTTEQVRLSSARHRAVAVVRPGPSTATWSVAFPNGPNPDELGRSFPADRTGSNQFVARAEAGLGRLLRRAAELAMALPHQAADTYAIEVAKAEADPPSTTEALRVVRQRIGQNLFRQALLDYWGGACAVTGLAMPALLRASHAKPWASCDTDQERLNAYNGLLLAVHLDALFDQGLLSFYPDGAAILSPRISPRARALYQLTPDLRLRWVAPGHQPFLEWHRRQVFGEG